jgi:hypothetical protein
MAARCPGVKAFAKIETERAYVRDSGGDAAGAATTS